MNLPLFDIINDPLWVIFLSALFPIKVGKKEVKGAGTAEKPF